MADGTVAIIPAGTPVVRADNLPQPNDAGIAFWVEPWDAMTPAEDSHARVYGFGVGADQVEKEEADWVFDNDVCPSSLIEDDTTGKLRPMDENETGHKWDEDTGKCNECGATRDMASEVLGE